MKTHINITKHFVEKQMTDRSMVLHNDQNVNDWYEAYVKFSNQESRLVKIYDWNSEELTFKMNVAKGINLGDNQTVLALDRHERRHIAKEVVSLYANMHTFSIGDLLFWHKDFNVTNLIYNPKKQTVTLIDPVSFQIINALDINANLHRPFVDTLYNIKQWELL